jgi:transposase
LNNEIKRILFEDEAMIRDYQAIHQTWFERGKQRKIKTYGKHEGVKLVGVLDYETGEIYCEEHKKYDAEVFLRFLKNIIKKYPEGKSVIILDNARNHHAKLLNSFLEENKEMLELVYLPPYSPDLNMIEGLWKWLKERVVYNVFYRNIFEIRENIKEFFKVISKEPQIIIDRLCCIY